MKAIEDQIRDNREQLDVDIPPAEIWNNIREGWKKEGKPKTSFEWWKVAAAIFFVSTIGLLVYTN